MIDNLNKTYLLAKNKSHYTLWTFFGSLVTCAILSGAILTAKDSSNYSVPVVIGIAVAIVIALTLLVFFLSKDKYITFTENGFEITSGNNSTRYSYKEYAGSKVTRNYTNGIYTGTSRVIKIKDLSGKTDDIECNGIGKDAFAEIVSYISINEITQNEGANVPENYFDNEKKYFVPSDTLIKANQKHFATISVLAGIGSIALLVIWIWAGFADTDINGVRSGVISTAIVLGIIGIIIAAYYIAKQLRTFSRMKTMPTAITLDSTSLKIDDKVFLPVNISSISVVPGNYEILTRDLVIMTHDGNVHRYCFGAGKNKNNNKLAYADYTELSNIIKLWCILNQVRFLYILG